MFGAIDPAYVWLGVIALGAATVNGALGYGFSSITVPLALLFTTSRLLNPALVLVEVAVNYYMLATHWKEAKASVGQVRMILIGLVPGVLVGSFFLASVSPDAAKLVTYVILLPMILIQAAGIRRPLANVDRVGLPFGVGIGVLYSVTTISGPPLALLFNNQGFAKSHFRASLAVVRAAESSLTAITYLFLGLFTPASLSLVSPILPAVLVGIPLGGWLIRRIDAETFRRVCMSFDAWIVSFGLSRVIEGMNVVEAPRSYVILAVTILVDLALLYRFFARRNAARRTAGWAGTADGATARTGGTR